MTQETQPRLAELFARYLDRQAQAHVDGTSAADTEVTPYDAGPVMPVEPALAWQEAQAALPFYGTTTAGPALPHWPALVAGQEPATALAFSAGNFPQMVRDFHLFLAAPELTAPRPQAAPLAVPQLNEWAEQMAERRRFPEMMLALAGLRLARQFDLAQAYASRHEAALAAEWRAGWQNEKAALDWHAGAAESARALWQTLPPTPPVLFNRGMSDLFLGRRAAARVSLEDAAAALPASAGWHLLARLYLTLA